uniref:Uncharacterized protein n=1 Tax=Avena sativa TaxID=4498 RepID=A0ACD5ZQA0_AVESA
MPSSSSSYSSSSDDTDYHAATSDAAEAVVLPRQADAAAVVSFLRTQEEVDEVCEQYGVPKEQYTARPAGDLRVSSPPPPGSLSVYAHALEAGMRVPLHGFFCQALAHFGVAPTQLTPNGWRFLAGFLALCHTVGVPPSLAVFRHFFFLSPVSHKHKGWYFLRSRDTSGLRFAGLPHSIKDCKHGFFFLSSAAPWPCPVEWGEPSKRAFMEPVLAGEEGKWAAKLLRAHGAAPVDVRTRLCERNLAAAMISPVSPPPPSCAGRSSSTSANSKGMDPSVYDMMKTMLADKAAAAAVRASASGKVKTEPGPSPLCGKKRSLDDEANIEEGRPPCSVPQKATPGAHGCSQMPTGDLSSPPPEFSQTPHRFASGHIGVSTDYDWESARAAARRRQWRSSCCDRRSACCGARSRHWRGTGAGWTDMRRGASLFGWLILTHV